MPHEWPTIATSSTPSLSSTCHTSVACAAGRVVAVGPAGPAEALEVERDHAVVCGELPGSTAAQLRARRRSRGSAPPPGPCRARGSGRGRRRRRRTSRPPARRAAVPAWKLRAPRECHDGTGERRDEQAGAAGVHRACHGVSLRTSASSRELARRSRSPAMSRSRPSRSTLRSTRTTARCDSVATPDWCGSASVATRSTGNSPYGVVIVPTWSTCDAYFSVYVRDRALRR